MNHWESALSGVPPFAMATVPRTLDWLNSFAIVGSVGIARISIAFVSRKKPPLWITKS